MTARAEYWQGQYRDEQGKRFDAEKRAGRAEQRLLEMRATCNLLAGHARRQRERAEQAEERSERAETALRRRLSEELGQPGWAE